MLVLAAVYPGFLVLYALVFLMGVARTFFNPTIRAAFSRAWWGEGDLTRANSLIGGTFSASDHNRPGTGRAAGSIRRSGGGISNGALVPGLRGTTLPDSTTTSAGGTARFRPGAQDGAAFLAGARVPLAIVVGAFLTILAINITIPAEVFLAKETFGAGDAGYGLLVGLFGGGMVLGSALMAALGDRAASPPCTS